MSIDFSKLFRRREVDLGGDVTVTIRELSDADRTRIIAAEKDIEVRIRRMLVQSVHAGDARAFEDVGDLDSLPVHVVDRLAREFDQLHSPEDADPKDGSGGGRKS